MFFVIVDGDQVIFLPTFGSAVVTPIPTTISGSAAKTTVTGKAACLQGDESKVESAGCAYVAPPFVTPGVATLKILSLAPDQLTKLVKIEGKPAIIVGSTFNAVLEVTTPAQQPTPAGPVPDPTPKYPGGFGSFVPSNAKVKAK